MLWPSIIIFSLVETRIYSVCNRCSSFIPYSIQMGKQKDTEACFCSLILSFFFFKGISVLENCNELYLDKVGKFPGKQSDCIQQLKQNAPTLTVVLRMDAVSRAAALRNSISSLETASVLSRDDCLWLFALCAAVDTPLHGDTCASLRILLRKCSGLLAHKSERRDEVAMLSILITITGKYFGQLDSL